MRCLLREGKRREGLEGEGVLGVAYAKAMVPFAGSALLVGRAKVHAGGGAGRSCGAVATRTGVMRAGAVCTGLVWAALLSVPGGVIGLAAAAGTAEQAGSAQAGAVEAPAPAAEATSAIAARLLDPTLADKVRQGAAEVLLQRAEDDEARAALSRALEGPISGTGGGIYVLRAIAASPDVSLRLFSILAQRVAVAEADELARLYEALGSFRVRDSARLLVAAVELGDVGGAGGGGEGGVVIPPEARAAAFAALERLSSRDDIPRDAAAWRTWLQESEQLTESEWRFALVRSLSRRSMLAERERDAVVQRLVEALRKQHVLTAQGERSALIATLLRDEQARVRDLGFELASRELAAGNTPGQEVVEAARELLAGRLPGVRASAADLLRAMAPADAGATIQEALSRESDPIAAAALLRASSRWPSSETAPAVLRWIEAGPPASDAAYEAAWQLSRAAALGQADGQRVLAALRRVEPASLTPAACTLLAALGSEADRDMLMPLLRTGAPAVRLAIAEGLVFDGARSDAVLNAALMDDALFDAAIRTALANDPTAADFEMARALPATTSEVRVAGLMRLAQGLTSVDLLTALRADGVEPSLRTQLLTLLVGQDRVLSQMRDPDERRAIGRGILLLATAQVERGELEAAAATIESSPFAARPAEVEGLVELRIAVLVALGRFELIDADEGAVAPLEGPPEPAEGPAPMTPPGIIEAWVRGAELGVGRPGAGGVIDRVREQFGPLLSDGQRQRLDGLEARLAKETKGAAQGDGVQDGAAVAPAPAGGSRPGDKPNSKPADARPGEPRPEEPGATRPPRG